MKTAWLSLLGAVIGAALLVSGCASGYMLDNHVQAFSQLAALPVRPAYRFERLPSQQVPAQAELEVFADGPLQKVGLRRDDANPLYSVQVSARVVTVLSPWASPWNGWGWGGWGWGGHRGGMGWGFGGSWGMEPPWYHREVSVIMRELSSSRVIFESSASNEGPWAEPAQVLPAMYDAALQGFPQPPAGPRRVDVPINQ